MMGNHHTYTHKKTLTVTAPLPKKTSLAHTHCVSSHGLDFPRTGLQIVPVLLTARIEAREHDEAHDALVLCLRDAGPGGKLRCTLKAW